MRDTDPLYIGDTDDEPWPLPKPERQPRFRYTDELQWARKGLTDAAIRLYRAAILRARRWR